MLTAHAVHSTLVPSESKVVHRDTTPVYLAAQRGWYVTCITWRLPDYLAILSTVYAKDNCQMYDYDLDQLLNNIMLFAI